MQSEIIDCKQQVMAELMRLGRNIWGQFGPHNMAGTDIQNMTQQLPYRAAHRYRLFFQVLVRILLNHPLYQPWLSLP
jgi:hypothetical protein